MPKRIWTNPIIPPSFPFSTHPSILLFPLPHLRSHPFFFSSFSSAFFVSFLPSPSSPHIKSLSEQPHWCFFFSQTKIISVFIVRLLKEEACVCVDNLWFIECVFAFVLHAWLCVFSRIVAIFPIFSLQPCSSQLFLFQSLISTHADTHTKTTYLPIEWQALMAFKPTEWKTMDITHRYNNSCSKIPQPLSFLQHCCCTINH